MNMYKDHNDKQSCNTEQKPKKKKKRTEILALK